MNEAENSYCRVMTDTEKYHHERRLKLEQIFNHFKAYNQLKKLKEEVGEFADAFESYFLHDPNIDNWEHMIEELADVENVLEQFDIILSIHAIYNKLDYSMLKEKIKQKKIERTLERIESKYYEH